MKKTLLILAAGMGSRFGGLKQIEPFGPNKEFIIDYSIYDAIKAGFNKVVFVIKKENLDIFKETISKRIEKQIETHYVFQENDVIKKREKPLGTGQAVLCTKDVINENFLMINADDFYGFDAYKKASDFMDKLNDETFALVGYKAKNTLTENGSVKRGVCSLNHNYLSKINESKLTRENGHIHCTSLTSNKEYDIKLSRLVSMNMILFTPKIFEFLQNDFKDFLDNTKDLLNDEFLIPEVLDKHIQNNDIKVKVLKTKAKWYGVTYKEDKEGVQNAINNLIAKKKYPYNLWGKK